MLYSYLRATVLLVTVAGSLACLPPARGEDSPRAWQNLLLWPGKPVVTVGSGSTCPALAASDTLLLLGEVNRGGVYLSELDSTSLSARWTHPVAAAVAGTERTNLRLALLGQTVWVAWLEAPTGTAPDGPRTMMLAAFDLSAQTARSPLEVAVTTQGDLTTYNQQLWVGWLGPRESRSLSLSAGAQETASVVNWQPPVPGYPVSLGLGECGGTICLPFVVAEGGRHSLWYATYNGHRFVGLRKLRGLGEMGPPTVCRLLNRLLVVYTLFPGAGERGEGSGDLLLTATDPGGTQLASVPYVQDGRVHLHPSVAAFDGTVFVAWNSWSARPGSESGSATNLGLFVGKVTPAL